MDQNKILQLVGESVIEKPLVISITRAPKNRLETLISKSQLLTGFFIFLGLLKPFRHEIKIKSLTLGTLYRISALICQIAIPANKPKGMDWLFELVDKNAKLTADIIAAAIHNSKKEVPKSLADFVLENLTPQELADVMGAISAQIDIENFINTIVSIRSLNILTAAETSQQITGEKIALGQE